jgi:hypothetical protein
MIFIIKLNEIYIYFNQNNIQKKLIKSVKIFKN